MAERRPDPKKHIALFALITALCLVGDSMLYIVLPVYHAEMGLGSLLQVGVVLAVNRIVRLPLNPLVGRFYSHVDERTGILWAVVLATLTTFSYGFLPGFVFWIASRCLWGVAWTLLRLGSLFCILRLSAPDDRGRCTGLYNGLYRLGSLVGMFFGGLLADTLGARTAAVAFGCVTALALPLAFFALPAGSGDKNQANPGETTLAAGFSAILRNRTVFRVVCGGTAVAIVIQGVIASTLSRLVEAHTRGGLTLTGTLIGASTLAGALQALRWSWEPWLAPLAGRISDARAERSEMLFLSFGAAAVPFMAAAFPLPLPLWFACILGIQLAATALTTLADASAADAACLEGGRALLMGYALLVDAGAAVGPLIAYSVDAILGIDAVYVLCALLFLLLFTGRKRTSLSV